jgi:hypothetical protein
MLLLSRIFRRKPSDQDEGFSTYKFNRWNVQNHFPSSSKQVEVSVGEDCFKFSDYIYHREINPRFCIGG